MIGTWERWVKPSSTRLQVHQEPPMMGRLPPMVSATRTTGLVALLAAAPGSSWAEGVAPPGSYQESAPGLPDGAFLGLANLVVENYKAVAWRQPAGP
jgi:hypothetical protein